MADQDNAGGNSGRAENSVLFSLSNLTAVGAADSHQKRQSGSGAALGSGGGAAVSSAPSSSASGAGGGGGGAAAGNAGQDRSGLIDLNTLTQLGAGHTSAPAASASRGAAEASSAAAVPALFNVGTRRSNKGLVVGIGFLLLVVLSLGGFLTYLLVFKEDPEANKNTATAAEVPVDEDENLGIDDAAANQAKAIEGEGEGDAADKDGEGEGEGEGEDGAGGTAADGAPEDGSAVVAAVDDSAKDDDKKSTTRKDRDTKKKDDDTKTTTSASKVDDAVAKAQGKGGNELDKSAVGKVLSSAALKAKSCGSGGDVTVKFSINPDGSTRGVVAVGGTLAGTPTAKCVEKVVKELEFPSSSDGATGVKYPFKL